MIKKTILSKRALAKHYNDDYLFNVCGGGKEFYQGTFHQRFHETIKIAEIKKGDQILDVGGGRGEIAFLASALGAKKIIVIDYSPSAIKIVKDFSKKLKHKEKISALIMDAKKLKFKDKSFDKIFFLEVLEHLYPKEADQVLQEMLRVLKPGGKLIISTGPNKLLMDILLFVSKIFYKKTVWKSRKYHINEQSFFSLKQLFKNHDISYKIYHEDRKSFFYGQIVKNQNLNPKLKNFVKIFNDFYDLNICRFIRSLPLLNILFCTSFLIVLRKVVKK